MAQASLIASFSKMATIKNGALLAKNFAQRFYNKIGDLVIDATTSEVIEHSVVITSHPVSSGAIVSDHAYSNPVSIKLEGAITNGSLYLSDINTLTGFFQGNLISNIYNYMTGPSQKQILAFNLLEILKENKDLVSVVTRMKSYDNMMIESLIFSRDKDAGDRLIFSITLKQIKLVSNKIVALSKSILSPTKQNFSNLANMGRGTVSSVSDETKANTKTQLLKDVENISFYKYWK